MQHNGRRTEAISIRVTPETKKAAQRIAETEHRTMANWLENLILKELARVGEADDA